MVHVKMLSKVQEKRIVWKCWRQLCFTTLLDGWLAYYKNNLIFLQVQAG